LAWLVGLLLLSFCIHGRFFDVKYEETVERIFFFFLMAPPLTYLPPLHFTFLKICGGKVLIDGVDASTLPLACLRRAIAVIPQEPHLFSGTVRFNLVRRKQQQQHGLVFLPSTAS
jgi:hypothetical protein